MSSTSLLQSAIDSQNTSMEIAVSVAKKAKNLVKAQGEAVLTLIDSAAAVSSVSGANASARGTGTKIDLLA